ncbi:MULTISPECIES: sulfurtransferase TusA family protein [Haloarcula]|uniref:sulfurtransferase TusA family protein n=1 Tax=Haloarcula TaxID=2237 RepID=UPI0023EDB075|nr:sulfurtransferase TusA family protein [Halomicroarcula sp. XH51]
MNSDIDASETLDVRGENCPMPVVKTKQAVDDIAEGETLEVLATDPGSMSDIGGWAESTADVELVDQQETEDGGETVFRHFVARVA